MVTYYTILVKRKDTQGVGFYIKKHLKKRLAEVKGISERIAVAKIKIGETTNLGIIQVYAPTFGVHQKEREEFYTLLEKTFIKERQYYNIVMGDFNVKVGQNMINELSVGKFAQGGTNENGESLVNLANKLKLSVAPSLYKKKCARKWTWKSPDGHTKNEIDHILVNDTRIVTNVEMILLTVLLRSQNG